MDRGAKAGERGNPDRPLRETEARGALRTEALRDGVDLVRERVGWNASPHEPPACRFGTADRFSGEDERIRALKADEPRECRGAYWRDDPQVDLRSPDASVLGGDRQIAH